MPSFSFKSEQVVPDWLEEAAEKALGTGYGPKGGKFASKDTRSVSESFYTLSQHLSECVI